MTKEKERAPSVSNAHLQMKPFSPRAWNKNQSNYPIFFSLFIIIAISSTTKYVVCIFWSLCNPLATSPISSLYSMYIPSRSHSREAQVGVEGCGAVDHVLSTLPCTGKSRYASTAVENGCSPPGRSTLLHLSIYTVLYINHYCKNPLIYICMK